MKAAVYYGNKTIRTEDIPVPEIKNDEILVQVKACGICGTDVHIFEGAKGAADCIPPKVLGHEFSGIAVKVGGSVKNIKEGDRVVVDPNDMCGHCIFCKSGEGHFCENMVGIGTTVNGGFEEYCSVRAKQAVKISDSLSFDEASFAEPVSCCLHGIDRANIKVGSTIMVIGAGPIGMIMLQLAKISGATELIVIEPVESKRETAKKFGASITINPLKENVSSVLKNNGIYNVNTVIECVGAKQTMNDALFYAGKCATIVFFGLTVPECEIAVKPFEIFEKELTITSSYINPYTIARAVSLLESGRISVDPLIADILPLEDLGRVLSDSRFRRGGKVIIHPEG